MKKLISLALALVMILSLATVAFANENSTTKTFELKKRFTTDVTGIYPDEDLTFTAKCDTQDGPTVTFKALNPTATDVKKDEEGNFLIQGTVSNVTKVGEWHYTVTEGTVASQGVNATDNSLELVVYVTLGEADALEVTVGGELVSDVKDDTIVNEYKLGQLSVTKEVTGTAGIKGAEFNIDVTFTSTKPVNSDITLTRANQSTETISSSTFTKAGDSNVWTATKTITLSDNQTATFTNIPVGVTYVVNEQSKHLVGEDNIVDVNDEDGDYTVSYTGGTTDGKNGGGITSSPSAVTVTNTKNAKTDTGIVLDSMPYIILLTLAAAGMFVLLTKKRAREF